MASRRKAQPTASDSTAARQRSDSDESAVAGSDDNPLAALSDLQTDDVIQVVRSWPPGNDSGWLCDLDVPPGGVEELPALLAQQYGGGTFQLRVKRPREGVRGRPYTSLAARIKIAGEPKSKNPQREERPSSTAAQPVVIQSGGSDLQAQMFNVLAQLASRSVGGAQPQSLDGLLQAFTQVMDVSQRRTDPYEGLERTMGLLLKMRNFVGSSGGNEYEPERRDAEPSFGNDMLNVFARMFMPQQAPQPMAPPVAPAMPPPPSPRHVYHPSQGWFVPGSSAPTPPRPATPPPPPRQEPAQVVDDDGDDELEDEGPCDADDMMSAFDDMASDEQERFTQALVARHIGKMPREEIDAALRQVGGMKPSLSVANGYDVTAD